eukprot:gene16816-16873_t
MPAPPAAAPAAPNLGAVTRSKKKKKGAEPVVVQLTRR